MLQSDETNYAKKYIEDNSSKLKLPYTGAPLNAEDIERIACADIQEQMNYILTECYDMVLNPRKLNQGDCQPIKRAASFKATKYTEIERILSICRRGIV